MASNQYEVVEERMEAALASICDENKPNIAALAREFNVPVSRLRARFHGRGNKRSVGESGRKLIDAQEVALCQVIDREEVDGTYLRQ